MQVAKKKLIPWVEWIVFGESTRGSGIDIRGKTCKRCEGTGIISTGDDEHPWCGCPECQDNAGRVEE